MKPQRIDHVALWVADREADTSRILRLFDVEILEKEDDFTLLGSDPELGKLTLFDAEGPRDQSQLMHVAFREPRGREGHRRRRRASPLPPGGTRHAGRRPRSHRSPGT